jgi:hypothetical protein
LQAQIDFVDDERFGHAEKLRATGVIKQDFPPAARCLGFELQDRFNAA